MPRLGLFVDGKSYDKMMQGHRQCRKCGEYFLRRTMVFTKETGLICRTCHEQLQKQKEKNEV